MENQAPESPSPEELMRTEIDRLEDVQDALKKQVNEKQESTSNSTNAESTSYSFETSEQTQELSIPEPEKTQEPKERKLLGGSILHLLGKGK